MEEPPQNPCKLPVTVQSSEATCANVARPLGVKILNGGVPPYAETCSTEPTPSEWCRCSIGSSG